MQREPHRIFGLDLLRTTAVLLVIFHHSLDYIHPSQWICSFGTLGSLGVEFLLVLTGYLVGQSVLKKMSQGRFAVRQLGTFYFRRWMRTLPPYYFFLLMMAALTPAFFAALWYHMEYFLFLQNVAWSVPPFYSQTWTLAVQEFFYILCPLFLLAGSRLFRRRLVAFLAPVSILLLVPLALRAFHTHVEDSLGFDQVFRKWVIFRFDSPVIGVILAFIEIELPGVWAWIRRHSWLGLSLILLMAAYAIMDFPYLYSSHWLQVFFFPVVSVCVALVFPYLCGWKESPGHIGMIVSSISNMTYTIYVSHFVAFYFAFALLLIYPIDSILLTGAVYFSMVWLVAYPSYLLIEAPLLSLRRDDSSRESYLVQSYRKLSASWSSLLESIRPTPALAK